MVEGLVDAVEQFLQIRPDVIKINLSNHSVCIRRTVARLDEQHSSPFIQHHARLRSYKPHPARPRRGHAMLHLHGFQHGHFLPCGHLVSVCHQH